MSGPYNSETFELAVMVYNVYAHNFYNDCPAVNFPLDFTVSPYVRSARLKLDASSP
jgi:hypothetical protein